MPSISRDKLLEWAQSSDLKLISAPLSRLVSANGEIQQEKFLTAMYLVCHGKKHSHSTYW